MSFFSELKRRNVFKVALAYVVAAWLVLQITEVLMTVLGLPDTAGKFVFLLLVIGFIPTLAFAWAYEVTPEGIKRESEVDRSESITRETAVRLNRITIGLVIAVAAMVIVDRFMPAEPVVEPTTVAVVSAETSIEPAVDAETAAPRADSQTADATPSVAVLPFVNMSDDQQNEYFSDGISEELLNVLVKIESLRVPSRTSSFTFKGSSKKLTEIGRELGVDHVLEGSVRKAGNRIRVTAQLIDVQTDRHLWSDTYTRELDDIFAVQDEIAQAIVEALKVTLTGDDRATLADRPTENVEAYNKYLLGRHLWNRRSPESLLSATVPLKEAVELDPGFDQAWAALADAYVLIPEYGSGSIEEFIPLAREAVQRALEINPRSAHALTASGYYKSMYDYDIPGALADFEKAIEIEPGYPTAHQWYGEILAVDRRLDEALEQVRIAKRLDPLAPIIHHVEGWLLQGAGRFEEALESYSRVLELNPHQQGTHGNLYVLYLRIGEYGKAEEANARLTQLTGVDAAPARAVIDAAENPGLAARALELLDESPDYIDGASANAQLFMLIGKYEEALSSLERAFEAGDPYAIHINRMGIYDPLQENPRFQALLRKMNLSDGSEVTR